MRKAVAVVVIGALALAAAGRQASAGDHEWAIAGKVLTGLIVLEALVSPRGSTVVVYPRAAHWPPPVVQPPVYPHPPVVVHPPVRPIVHPRVYCHPPVFVHRPVRPIVHPPVGWSGHGGSFRRGSGMGSLHGARGWSPPGRHGR